MKKSNITVSYDDEKLSAIQYYMGKKNADLHSELEKSMDSFYNKYVPSNVREFVEMKESTQATGGNK